MAEIRQPLSRRSFLVGVAGLGGGLALASCTSGGGKVGKQSGAASHGTPRPGGTAVMAQSADIAPTTVLGQNLPNLTWQRLVWNTLTEYDRKTLQPKPALATAWSLSSDQRTLTMTLRDDVTFHSGRPFGPKDVVAAIQNQTTPPAGLTNGQLLSAAAAISDASASGRNTVKIQLSYPISNLFDLFEAMFILDTESLDELAAGTSFVGTGPFTFGSREPNVSMQLKKNAKYWKSNRPYLDAVTLRVISQPQALLSALRSDQAQLAANLSGTALEGLQNNDAFTITELQTRDAVWYVGCNVNEKPLDDPMVRQAISYALDRKKVLTDVLGNMGQVTSIPWSQTSSAYDANAVGTYTYDPEKAKKLLAQAGASGASLHIAANAGQTVATGMAEAVQYSMQQAGLKVTIDPLQDADFTARLIGAKFPGLWVAAHGFNQMHPATLLNGAYPYNAAKNASNFSAPEYTNLSQKVFRATGSAAQKAASDEVTKYLLDQQFVAEMVGSSYTYTTVAKLQGYDYSMMDFLNMDDAFISS